MSVVVDQFDVVPTPSDSGERPAAPPAATRTQSFDEDVQRVLRTRAERAARLEAH